MKATLYKKLSNEKTPIEIKAGQTVREALPDFDLENAIIVVNGKIRNPDYKLEEKDIVMIRLTPAMTGLIITAAIGAIVALGASIYTGVKLYKAKAAAEKAQEEIEKVKKLTNKSDIDNRPFLRGASNTLATGNSQPYIIGRHFFTPYLLSKPFYQLTGPDGANQYTYTTLECGFNKQILQTVAIDDIIIKKFNDSTPQEGAYSIDAGIFAEDGKIEIAQDGALLTDLPALNYKTESTACNDEIPHDSDVAAGTSEYLTYSLNPYAKDVDIAITFPYGLYAMNNDGDNVETETTITPQYSLDGGSTWSSFTFNNNGSMTNRFKRKEPTKELRFVAHHDFTAADYVLLRNSGANAIYIRVLNGGKSGDSMIHNDCYVLYYQSVCYDPDKSTSELVPCRVVEDRERAYCTILGLKLKATKINEDKLKKINIVTQGVARTWNGTAWSAEKTATRNPAAWALEILTSPIHPASRYDDSEIDLESFGELYEWCETNGYKFDWIITQSTTKNDTLNYIMDAAGSCMFYDITGRLAEAEDRPQENALAVYNPQNIISIQNKKTFGRRTDGLRIKYINSKDDLFQEDTYLVMREGQTLNQDSIIKDVAVTGITEYDYIVKYARRLMAIEALRPKTTVIETGNEGIFYTPFSKILIQDDSLKIGIGKGYTIRDVKWWGGLLKKIYTNEPLTFDPAKTYGIIVNCFTADGAKPVALKVEGTGTTNEFIILSSFSASEDAKPEVGNVFSFGELDTDGEFSKVTTEYLISQIKRSEKGFNLELVNYNEAVYDSGAIPEYKSNMSQKKTAAGKTIPADAVTKAELAKEVALAVGKVDPSGSGAAQEAANEVVHGIHFTNIHRIRDMELSLEEILDKIDRDRAEQASGISVTKDEIMLYVNDTERELRAALSIQSSSITAMVQGGGAEGQLSLSLELPAIVDSATLLKMMNASSEGEVSAVYAKLAGTDMYTIKGNASRPAVKALWDKMVSAGLLASQIDLSATQINVAAENVVITGSTNKGQTIIEGGFLRTALIDVDTILAKKLTIRDGGSLQSENYRAGVDGWKISSDGSAEFSDGKFRGVINASSGVMNSIYVQNSNFLNGTINCGSLQVKRTILWSTNVSYSTSNYIHQLYSHLRDRGATSTNKTVAQLYSDLDTPKMYIGSTEVNRVSIWTSSMITPFSATLYHIMFDDTTEWIDYVGMDVQEVHLPNNWKVDYKQGDKLTFMLEDLPTSQPTERNVVWRDGTNLRIS